MNAAVELLNHPIFSRIGWALLHSLWQGTLAALAFALVRSSLHRHSAQARYLIGCFTLLVVVLAPILTVCSTGEAATPLDPRAHGAFYGNILPAIASSTTSGAVGGIPWPAQILDRLEQTVPWLVPVWILGVVAFSCRWLQGSFSVRQVRRAGESDASLICKLEELKQRLGISRPVRLLRSTLIEVPVVVGWLRPVILIPGGVLSGLGPAELEAILAHELAHVRRLDYLVNTFQNIVETLLFYHPAVWWISRCIREEREHCCDDLVVQCCGDRLAYARALFSLEELRGISNFAFAANGGSLLSRVRRLLGGAADPRPLGPREIAGLSLAGLGFIVLAAGALLILRPSMFVATAVIRVDPDSGVSAEPFFLPTEVAMMHTPAVLQSALESLQVPAGGDHKAQESGLTRGTGLRRLESGLRIWPQDSTRLVRVGFSDRSPIEAARVANEIAKAYQQYRLEHRRKASDTNLKAVELRIEQLEGTIQDIQRKADRMRLELGIPDDQGDGPAVLTADTLRRLETLRIESEANLIQDQTLLEELRKLKGEELYIALQTVATQDRLMGSLAEGLVEAEQKVVELKKEFGPQHPEVVKAVARMADYQEKLKQRAEGFMTGLEVKIASMKSSIEQLQKEMNRAKVRETELATRSRPYWDAKNKVDDLKSLRQLLVQKFATERITSELSRTPPVDIIEQAVAPSHPSTARIPGAACIAAGLLLSLLGTWLARSANG